jgi:hypothetical protein
VFQNLREAQCSECGAEIEQGSFLSMELERRSAFSVRVSTISSFFHRATLH